MVKNCFLDINDKEGLQTVHRILFFDESKDLDAENSEQSDEDEDFVDHHFNNSNESGNSDFEVRTFLEKYYTGEDNVEKWTKSVLKKN